MNQLMVMFKEAQEKIKKIAPHTEEIWVGNMILADAHVFRFIPELTDIPTTPGYFQHHWGIKVVETDKVPEMELWFVRDGVPYKKHSFGLDPKPKRQWGEMIQFDEIKLMKDIL